MKKNERELLYVKCKEKWGYLSQVDMCIEELAELTQALCKAKRYDRPKKWLAAVYEEIADVTIMLEQMIILYDGEEIIPQYIEDKLLRLKDRVEEIDKDPLKRQ